MSREANNLQVSQRGPYGEIFDYRAFLHFSRYISLTFISGSPGKEPSALSLFRVKRSIPRDPFINLSMSLVDETPCIFPNGGPMERDAHLQSLFTYSPRTSQMESSLQFPFTDLPQSERPHLHSTFQPSLKFPRRQAHSSLSSESQCKEMPGPQPALHNLGYPGKVPSLQPSAVRFFRERRPIPRTPLIHLSKFPLDGPPPQFPQRSPYMDGHPSNIPLTHISPRHMSPLQDFPARPP